MPSRCPPKRQGLQDGPRRKIWSAFMPRLPVAPPMRCCAQFAGQGFGAFKPALAELLVETLRPIRDRFVALKDDTAAIDAVLQKGAEKARELGRTDFGSDLCRVGLIALTSVYKAETCAEHLLNNSSAGFY